MPVITHVLTNLEPLSLKNLKPYFVLHLENGNETFVGFKFPSFNLSPLESFVFSAADVGVVVVVAVAVVVVFSAADADVAVVVVFVVFVVVVATPTDARKPKRIEMVSHISSSSRNRGFISKMVGLSASVSASASASASTAKNQKFRKQNKQVG